jgi:hypothetical protein
MPTTTADWLIGSIYFDPQKKSNLLKGHEKIPSFHFDK